MSSDEPAAVPVALPSRVRHKVVGWAAATLGTLTAEQVPPVLKAVARFTPTKRARSGATALAAALDSDQGFRQRVATWVRAEQPELSRLVDAAEPLPAAHPVDRAALAYILRPPGWQTLVRDAAAEAVADDERAGHEQAKDEVARLREELHAARLQARDDVARLKSEAAAQAAVGEQLRRALREVQAQMRALRAESSQVMAEAELTVREAREATQTAQAEGRRLRGRLAEAESGLDAARRATREGRQADSVRLRLLLDTVVGAANGLRRELALPPLPDAGTRPADFLTGDGALAPDPVGVDDLAARALAPDDPAMLDRLLELAQVHLVVDGYNVTKSGYGTVSLAAQRNRLVTGLAALAGRTGAEVTCVFDGTSLPARVIQTTPRGVRVLFSPQGQSADELIERLVQAEPTGRPVVVVSSDREVAEAARAAGARAVPSAVLLRRLDRA